MRKCRDDGEEEEEAKIEKIPRMEEGEKLGGRGCEVEEEKSRADQGGRVKMGAGRRLAASRVRMRHLVRP